MLNDLITYLNTLITAQGDFQKVRGLCEVVTPKGSTAAFPAEWSKEKNGYERATDFDKWDGSTYWRLTGPIGTNQVNSPVRALSDIERTYPLRLVCSMKRSLIPNAQNTAYAHDKLAWAVQKVFKDKEQNIKTELGARYVSLAWGAVNHDHSVIQSTELANVERVVGSGWVLITMDLAITVRMSRECIADFQDEVTAPTSLTATSGAASIALAWTSVLSEFWIYRSTDGIEWRKIDESATTSYSDTSAAEGSAYFYRVKGRSGGVLSSWSNIAGAQRFSASLSVDFTFSSTIIDDETTLTLTATGDSGDIYMWTDVVADEVIGKGSPLVIPNYKWGVNTRTIKLDVTSSSGAYGTVTKTDELTVTIKQVDEFMTRVDAQIALTGGSYTTAQRFGLDRFIWYVKHQLKGGIQALKHSTFWPVFPASQDVAKLEFFGFDGYITGNSPDLEFFNSPTLTDNLIQTNGTDSYFLSRLQWREYMGKLQNAVLYYAGADVGYVSGTLFQGFVINATARYQAYFATSVSPHTVVVIPPNINTSGSAMPNDSVDPLAFMTWDQTQINNDPVLTRSLGCKRQGQIGFDIQTATSTGIFTYCNNIQYIPHGAYGRIDDADTDTPTVYAPMKYGSIFWFAGASEMNNTEAESLVDEFLTLQTTLGR